MKLYYITIEKIPGDPRYEEYFTYECDDENQAWDYARDKWRTYGPSMRVKQVKLLKEFGDEQMVSCAANDR